MKPPATQIAPSLMAANFEHLRQVLENLNRSKADLLHIDMMDGIFVDNLSIGFPVLETVTKYSRLASDFHLMMQHPLTFVGRLADMGAHAISVHVEAPEFSPAWLNNIRRRGVKAGLAIKPATNIDAVYPYLRHVDKILVMSVEPGYSGQLLLSNIYDRLHALTQEMKKQGIEKVHIQVDGGVTLENAPLLTEAGAQILVGGNVIFGEEDPLRAVQKLKSALLC